ncbi:MAG: hypothetical protein ACYC6R_05260 [Anaerolineales bacterium]
MKRWIISTFVFMLCACQSSTLTAPVPVTPSIILPAPESTHAPALNNGGGEQTLDINNALENSPHANIIEGNLLLPQESNENIRCDECHESKNGVTSATIAWWNPETQVHELVPDSNALCLKCHTDFSASIHQANNLAHQDFKCIDCHDPHSTTASCSNSTCHANIIQIDDQPPATPSGIHPDEGNPFCGGSSCHPAATQAASKPHSIHGFIHAGVTCVACHDASGLQVGPDPNEGLWVAWRMVVDGGGSPSEPYASHSIQLKVDCMRCHFSNNPWNLSTVTGSEFDH